MAVAEKPRVNLPAAWNWCFGGTNGPDLDWQVAQLEAGRPLIPTLIKIGARERNYTTAVQARLAAGLPAVIARKLPILLRADNVFYNMDTFDWFQTAYSYDPAEHENHPYRVVIKAGGELDTITTHFSEWSPHAPVASRKLGYLYATSDLMVELARMYPDPPAVYCLNNNEIGLDFGGSLPEVREPAQFGVLRELVQSLDADDKCRPGMQKLLNSVIARAQSMARNSIMVEFDRGFREGLLTHNTHWADACRWVAYSQAGQEAGVPLGFKRQSGAPDGLKWNGGGLSEGGENWQVGRHFAGATGSSYLHSWFGEWWRLRAWGQLSSTRTYRDFAESLSGRKPRFELLWQDEGAKTWEKPDRIHWRGFVRAALWLSHTDYFGHFAASTTKADSEPITVYYDEMINACAEVRDNPVLKRFWEAGELLESIDKSPFDNETTHPACTERPWYFLHVVENERYTDSMPFDPTPGFRWDKWRRDRTHRSLMKVAALAYRLGQGADTEYLVYVCAPLEDQAATIRLTLELTVLLKAPVGGRFYLVKPDGAYIAVTATP